MGRSSHLGIAIPHQGQAAFGWDSPILIQNILQLGAYVISKPTYLSEFSSMYAAKRDTDFNYRR